MAEMFKHSDSWMLNARILRLQTDHKEWGKACDAKAGTDHDQRLERIVREEISQDRGLVWC